MDTLYTTPYRFIGLTKRVFHSLQKRSMNEGNSEENKTVCTDAYMHVRSKFVISLFFIVLLLFCVNEKEFSSGKHM